MSRQWLDGIAARAAHFANSVVPPTRFPITITLADLFPEGCQFSPSRDPSSIPMQESVDEENLKECIIRNLCCQDVLFPCSFWIEVVNFLQNRSTSMNAKSYEIALQLLFASTKSDREDLERFDSTLEKELVILLPLLAEFEASELDEDRKEMARQFLGNPVIFRAINQALEKVERNVEKTEFEKYVNEMKIYGGKVTAPVFGFCVVDGIFINLAEMDRFNNENKNKAIFLTLVAHESIHYIVRRIFNNFAFSSPMSNLREGHNSPRKDEQFQFKKLELGRHLELKLFGKQPDWRVSAPIAAVQFFDLLENPDVDLPLKIDGLGEGIPNISFGIAYKKYVGRPKCF